MVLLGTVGLGHVGVNIRALPVVLPVRFVVFDGGVVFPAGQGTELHRASAGAIVAFEADDGGSSGRTGWSVLLQGPASVVTDPEAVAKLSASEIDLSTADESEDCFVHVHGTIVTGRRFTR